MPLHHNRIVLLVLEHAAAVTIVVATMMIIIAMPLSVTSFQQQQLQQKKNQYSDHRRLTNYASSFLGRQSYGTSRRRNTNSRVSAGAGGRTLLVMRDKSACYWFAINDRVRVVEDVYINHQKTNLKHRVGTVIQTWEKCDIDPTCCCAEQVDTNYAVRVEFGVVPDDTPPPTTTTATPPLIGSDTTITTETAAKSIDNNRTSATRNGNGTNKRITPEEQSETTFSYYFSEDELVKL